MNAVALSLFALLWLGILYGLNCALARKLKPINLKQASVYFMTVALIGVFGEILLDTVYNHIVGHPLWRYNILPIHNAYTSSYAVVIWGLYGFHLYLLHHTLEQRYQIARKYWAILFCFEALLFEALLTISARWLLGDFMYYYYPGDLWHVSSFQNIPFYYICGLVILKTLPRFKKDPLFFSAMSAALLAVVVFLV